MTRTISFVTYATSTGTTITGPAVIQAGDILVLVDDSVFMSQVGVIPAGFSLVAQVNFDDLLEQNISVKIADGSEASASLTGLDGLPWKILLVFRPSAPAVAISAHSVNGQFTFDDPDPQTVTAGSGTPPLIVLGFYRAVNPIDPRTMLPSKSGEANLQGLWAAWKIYNASSSNVIVDMENEGENVLQSLYLQVEMEPEENELEGETLHISSTEFRASAGKFDASKRYLRAGSTGSFFPIPHGKTVDIFRNPTQSDTSRRISIRYSVNGYIRERTDIDSGDFDATVTLTTL